MAYNTLALRPHVQPTSQVMGLIAPGHCWHFDAWLYSAGPALFVRVETRRGGRDLLTCHMYEWTGQGLRYCADVPEGAQPATVNDRALYDRRPELDRLHAAIAAMAGRVPAGYRSRSVAFHYVRAPSIAPFDDGVSNFHQYSAD